MDEERPPQLLYSLSFTQRGPPPAPENHEPFGNSTRTSPDIANGTIQLGLPSLDLVFDDRMLEDVKTVWDRIMQASTEQEASETPNVFMTFEDRQEPADDLNSDD